MKRLVAAIVLFQDQEKIAGFSPESSFRDEDIVNTNTFRMNEFVIAIISIIE